MKKPVDGISIFLEDWNKVLINKKTCIVYPQVLILNNYLDTPFLTLGQKPVIYLVQQILHQGSIANTELKFFGIFCQK